MKNILSLLVILYFLSSAAFSQKNRRNEKIKVPAIVKASLYKKYPNAKKVTWEKEDGNFEANWGGESGEANSVQLKPDGTFIEIVNAIPVNKLPEPVIIYVNKHYKGSKITEAGKVTDAEGNTFYEAEIKSKDFIFDENGKLVKAEK